MKGIRAIAYLIGMVQSRYKGAILMKSLNKFLAVEDANAGLLYRAYYAFFFSGMMANVIGSILPNIVETYGLTLAFQGTLVSINQIGNLIAVLLSGFLPYAIGRKKSTLILGSGIVLGFLIMSLTGNPLALVAAFIALGVGRGTMSNITNVIVGQYAGNKAAGLNLLHSAFAVGAFISPFLIVLFGKRLWKAPAIIIAIGMASALTLFYFSNLENKKAQRDKNEIPRAASFWLNTFILFFYLCAEATFMGWFVTYFIKNGIFPTSIANAMSSLLWIMILISRMLSATLSGKMMKEKLIMTLGSSMLIFTALMVFSSNRIVVALSVLAIGLSMGGIYPTVLSTMEARFTKSTIATGTCISVATIGAVIMPSIIGYVADTLNIAIAMKTILIPLTLMVILELIKLLVAMRNAK